MISKRDLERHLQRHGCELLRQGSRHEVWWNPESTCASCLAAGMHHDAACL